LGETPAETPLSGASVWWSWTAPADGALQIAATGANPWVMVYTGSSVTTLSRQTNAVILSNPGQNVRLSVDAGVVYHIAVEMAWGAPDGPVALELEWFESPSNDAFAAAIPFSGRTGVFSGSNRMATAELGEPNFAIPCWRRSGGNGPHRSMAQRWQASSPPASLRAYVCLPERLRCT
jgi:hypothetical protein